MQRQMQSSKLSNHMFPEKCKTSATTAVFLSLTPAGRGISSRLFIIACSVSNDVQCSKCSTSCLGTCIRSRVIIRRVRSSRGGSEVKSTACLRRLGNSLSRVEPAMQNRAEVRHMLTAAAATADGAVDQPVGFCPVLLGVPLEPVPLIVGWRSHLMQGPNEMSLFVPAYP